MSLGIGEILLLIVLVLLVFGAGKLPRVMEDVAKGVKAFRKGMTDDVSEQKPLPPTQVEQAPKDKDAA